MHILNKLNYLYCWNKDDVVVADDVVVIGVSQD